MRLELMTPPTLVTVSGMPALLLARRGRRCYVQVSRGPGLNHLRWVPDDALQEGPVDQRPALARGLPWVRPRLQR